MKAVVLSAPGPAENLALRDVPMPDAGDDHVVLKVRACGVAHRDVIERGREMRGMRYPVVQGHEFAGEIASVGRNVTGWREGDRAINLYNASCGHCPGCDAGHERRCRNIREVYGLTVDGGYAQYCRVHPSALVRLIDGIDWPAAATLMSALGVGYNNVVHKAGVKAGECVLITGASGGVGIGALQTAKYLGAQAWAVTSSEDKRQALLDLGADHVIVDDGTSIHKQVRRARPEGVDAVIDCVGSPTLNASLRSVRGYGRVVAVGNVDPAPLSLNIGMLVVNAIDLLGSDNITRRALDELMPLVRDGAIDPVIDTIFPLDGAAQAHRRIEARDLFGRLVLDPTA